MTRRGYGVLLLGQHTYRPGHVGTRAPVRLGIRVGVQSNPSLTMSPQGRGIRRGGHHLPGCFSDIARVPNTRSLLYLAGGDGGGGRPWWGAIAAFLLVFSTRSVACDTCIQVLEGLTTAPAACHVPALTLLSAPKTASRKV